MTPGFRKKTKPISATITISTNYWILTQELDFEIQSDNLDKNNTTKSRQAFKSKHLLQNYEINLKSLDLFLSKAISFSLSNSATF